MNKTWKSKISELTLSFLLPFELHVTGKVLVEIEEINLFSIDPLSWGSKKDHYKFAYGSK